MLLVQNGGGRRLYFVDPSQLNPPPAPYEAPTPLEHPLALVESPLELMPDGTSTITLRRVDGSHIRSADTRPGVTVPLDGAIETIVDGTKVTVEISNAKLVAALRGRFPKLLTFLNVPRADNLTDEQFVDSYSKKAAKVYECLTGNKAVGVPLRLKLRFSVDSEAKRNPRYERTLFFLISRQDAVTLAKAARQHHERVNSPRQ